MKISLKAYAEKHGINYDTLRRRISRGALPQAVRLEGTRVWMIDDDAVVVDRRVKSGEYKDWRKPKSKSDV